MYRRMNYEYVIDHISGVIKCFVYKFIISIHYTLNIGR